jgi:hypothetical protein
VLGEREQEIAAGSGDLAAGLGLLVPVFAVRTVRRMHTI